MRTNSQKNDFLALDESEEYPVTAIDTKTPYLLAFRLKLFGMEGWMKWILFKSFSCFRLSSED